MRFSTFSAGIFEFFILINQLFVSLGFVYTVGEKIVWIEGFLVFVEDMVVFLIWQIDRLFGFFNLLFNILLQ